MSLLSGNSSSSSGRLSPAWCLNLAEAYLADGQAAKAMKLLESTQWRGLPDINQRADWLVRAGSLILKQRRDDSDNAKNAECTINSTLYTQNSTIKTNPLLPSWIEDGIEECYSASPTLTDLYARIGWDTYWSQKEYAKVIEWLKKDLTWGTSAQTGTESDKQQKKSLRTTQFPNSSLSTGRLSFAWQINLAQTYLVLEDLESAVQLIDNLIVEAAECPPTTKLSTDTMQWLFKTKTSVLFKKGLSPEDILDKLHEETAKAYNRSPNLKDLLSAAAWETFIPRREDYRAILPFIKVDFDAKRLSPEWEINRAVALAVSGQFEKAVEIVDSVYARNATVKDGYARIGWAGYVHYKDCRDRAFEWYERDISLRRISAAWRRQYACDLAAFGDLDQAIAEAELAYVGGDAPDVFSLVGVTHLMYSRPSPKILQMAVALMRKSISQDKSKNEFTETIRLFVELVEGGWERAFAEAKVIILDKRNVLVSPALLAWLAMFVCPAAIPLEENIAMFDKEEMSHRPYYHTGWEPIKAGFIAKAGNRQEAVDIVKNAVELNGLILDGYSHVALGVFGACRYSPTDQRLFQNDYDAKRMSSGMKLIWAFLLSEIDIEKSGKILREAKAETGMALRAAYRYSNAFAPEIIDDIEEYSANDEQRQN